MRKLIGVALATFLIATAAAAQDVPKVEVFGGYSLERLGYSTVSSEEMSSILGSYGISVTNSEIKKFLKKGFDASFAYNVTNSFGIEADFRYNSGDVLTTNFTYQGISGSVKAKYSDFAFLAGPKFSLRKNKSVTPFAHALVGFDHAKLRAEASAMGQSESMDAGSDTGLGLALGGGLDVKVNKSFAIRIIQADYFLTKYGSETLNNVSLAFGVVFRLGGK